MASPSLLIASSSCGDTHYVKRVPGLTSALSHDASVYVAVPQDGKYGRKTYRGSGVLAAQAVSVAFAPYVTRLTVGHTTEDFNTAHASAKAGHDTYLLYSEILHWEDRKTEWSGLPDKVSIKVSLVEVETGNILDSAVIGDTGGVIAVNIRPEHLLPKPLAEYAASLYGQ